MSDDVAPEGKIWRCPICGRYSFDRYGVAGWRTWGWWSECTDNAELVDLTQEIADTIPEE